jgi:hypothetical protein
VSPPVRNNLKKVVLGPGGSELGRLLRAAWTASPTPGKVKMVDGKPVQTDKLGPDGRPLWRNGDTSKGEESRPYRVMENFIEPLDPDDPLPQKPEPPIAIAPEVFQACEKIVAAMEEPDQPKAMSTLDAAARRAKGPEDARQRERLRADAWEILFGNDQPARRNMPATVAGIEGLAFTIEQLAKQVVENRLKGRVTVVEGRPILGYTRRLPEENVPRPRKRTEVARRIGVALRLGPESE